MLKYTRLPSNLRMADLLDELLLAITVRQVMDRYWKEEIQVSTKKNDIKVQYLYDKSNSWTFASQARPTICLTDQWFLFGFNNCPGNWSTNKVIPNLLHFNSCSQVF